MPQLAYPSTFHNGESTKSTLLPSKHVLNGSDVADWALVAPRPENETIAKISSQIISSQCVVGFCGLCWKLFFDLGCVKNNSNAGHLRCISGLVRTGKSDNDKDPDWILLITVWATSDQLELSVHLLCLTQETSEKNKPNVLL